MNDDETSRRRVVKVTFSDGNTVNTDINGTKKEIEDHYIGKEFNFGVDGDVLATGVSVEFIR